MQDSADPHARDGALTVVRRDTPFSVSSERAVKDVLDSIGDSCPECPPDCG
jgi:hypothetical protein